MRGVCLRNALVLCLGLVMSCTTKVEGLYMSDTFTYSSIKKDQFIIGGIVATSGHLDPGSRNTMANILRAQILEEHGYYNVVEPGQLISDLGEKEYTDLLEIYQRRGLDKTLLEKVAAKKPKGRFLVLTKIDSDNTATSKSETAPSETKDSKGKTVREPGKITKSHSRTIRATMHIYDLTKGDVAFSGSVTKSRSNENNYEKSLVGDVVSLVSAVKGDDPEKMYPTPEAPPTTEVLKDVFAGFAENFPEED